MSVTVVDIIEGLIKDGERFSDEDRMNQNTEYHDWYFKCVSFVNSQYGKYDKGVKTKEYLAISKCGSVENVLLTLKTFAAKEKGKNDKGILEQPSININQTININNIISVELQSLIDKSDLEEYQKQNLKTIFEQFKNELQNPNHDESKLKNVLKGIIDYGLKFTPIALKLIEMYYK